MARIEFAHLCDYALISSDGKLSVLGIFSGINVVAIPAVHAGMYLAFELTARTGDLGRPFDLRIEVVDTDGKPLLRMERRGVVQGQVKAGEDGRHPEVVRLPPLPIAKAGPHAVNIFLNGRVEKELAFAVTMVTPPPPPAVS